MSITLTKGGNLSLTKTDATLTKISVGLGWDTRSTSGDDFDLDASAFLLNASGKTRSTADFIFYNQLRSAEGSVEHAGDNRTGAGDGDDEVIRVDLALVPSDVERVAFTVTIHEAQARRQSFGMVENAFVRIVDERNNKEVVRYDLREDASVETALIFAELYRHGGEWKFRAVGQGFAGGLQALCHHFGINI